MEFNIVTYRMWFVCECVPQESIDKKKGHTETLPLQVGRAQEMQLNINQCTHMEKVGFAYLPHKYYILDPFFFLLSFHERGGRRCDSLLLVPHHTLRRKSKKKNLIIRIWRKFWFCFPIFLWYHQIQWSIRDEIIQDTKFHICLFYLQGNLYQTIENNLTATSSFSYLFFFLFVPNMWAPVNVNIWWWQCVLVHNHL